jgi:hypothetical protein
MVERREDMREAEEEGEGEAMRRGAENGRVQ